MDQTPQPPRDLSRVPPALRKHVFKPGQSGNPGGRPKRGARGDAAAARWMAWLVPRLLGPASKDLAQRYYHRQNPGTWPEQARVWLDKQPREQWPTLLEVMFEEAAVDNCRNPGALANVMELGRMIFADKA